MKHVAPELDSLMWTLAEEQNERAIDEFGERHPELRAELLHRIHMVKGIRGAKTKPVETSKPIPKFVPSAPRPAAPIYVVAGLVLLAIGALAFVVTTLITPIPHTSIKEAPPPVSVDTFPGPGRPSVPVPSQNETTPTQNYTSPPVAEEAPDSSLRPGTLKVEDAPLLDVLQMMGESCSIEIDAAPGMPNPKVTVDYKDLTAMDMLRDLGRRYSFTALDQYNGTILVVPAVDPNATSSLEPPGGNFGQPKVGG